MVRGALILSAAAGLVCNALVLDCRAQDATTPEAAARQWLSYLDGGDYAKGWDRAGDPFKAHNSAALLQGKIGPAREPLGAVMERRLFRVTYADTAPGLSQGKYAAVQFDSRFANDARTGETVWLDLEKDRWAVIGYFIGGGDFKKVARPASEIGAAPEGRGCTHDEQVQARIARRNGYTGGPKCSLPE